MKSNFCFPFTIVLLYLCFHCNNMRADFTSNVLEGTRSINSEMSLQGPTPECYELLEIFADVASNFTKCSIKHARPIRICEKCIDNYVNFTAAYDDLLKVRDGVSCKSFFISNDRLDVVLEYHDNVLNVWDKGHCNECFDWNTTSHVVSKNTEKFNSLYIQTKTCFDENKPNATNSNNTEDVCQKCMAYYLQLDEHYKTLSSDAIGVDSVCIDVVDSMNETRTLWSKTYGCCKLRKSPEIIFLACSGIISMLPLLYYIAVRYCGPIRDLPNVLKQSRFNQRLLRMGGGGSIN